MKIYLFLILQGTRNLIELFLKLTKKMLAMCDFNLKMRSLAVRVIIIQD